MTLANAIERETVLSGPRPLHPKTRDAIFAPWRPTFGGRRRYSLARLFSILPKRSYMPKRTI
jgi:hypothetical protein